MNSDRELLEIAARAAGVHIDKSSTNGGGRTNTGFDMLGNAVTDWHNGTKWNPITDDGDALRLAMTLGLSIGIDLTEGCTRIMNEYEGTLLRHMHFDGGIAKATRSAIVRAAAEIGKAKP